MCEPVLNIKWFFVFAEWYAQMVEALSWTEMVAAHDIKHNVDLI